MRRMRLRAREVGEVRRAWVDKSVRAMMDNRGRAEAIEVLCSEKARVFCVICRGCPTARSCYPRCCYEELGESLDMDLLLHPSIR